MCAKANWRPLLAMWGIGLLACLGVTCNRNSAEPPADGREVAESFLKDIRENRLESAWKGTTAEFKSFMGLQRLRQLVKSSPAFKEPSELSDFRGVSLNGLSMAEYTFRPKSGKSTIKILLGREQDQWKVERVSVE